jgi:hypothetical protein
MSASLAGHTLTSFALYPVNHNKILRIFDTPPARVGAFVATW